MTILVSVLAALIGGVMFLICTKPEYKRLGELTYFAGILGFVLQAGPMVVSLFGR